MDMCGLGASSLSLSHVLSLYVCTEKDRLKYLTCILLSETFTMITIERGPAVVFRARLSFAFFFAIYDLF